MASRARLLTMHRITDHIIVIKDIAYRGEVFYFGKEELALGGAAEIPSFSAILTRSGSDFASILRINWLRWTFTVASLAFISAAICLLRRPEMSSGSTSLSRGVSVRRRPLEVTNLGLAQTSKSIFLERHLHGIEQILVVKRFDQEFDGSSLHGFNAHGDVAMRGYEDNRNADVGLAQADVENRFRLFQAISHRGPGSWVPPDGLQQEIRAPMRNSLTGKPTVPSRRRIASRTEGSSSTTKTIGLDSFSCRSHIVDPSAELRKPATPKPGGSISCRCLFRAAIRLSLYGLTF